MKYILQLGSNIDNRENYLSLAISSIENLLGEVVQKSAIYESEAWGNEALNNFLNQLIVVESYIMPFEFLEKCQKIEKEIGRKEKKGIVYENRVIDIDLLFIENFIIYSKELTIPHGKIPQRAFILIPLVELFPHGIHPTLFLTFSQLLDNNKDNLYVRKLE